MELLIKLGNVEVYKTNHKKFRYVTMENNCKATQKGFKKLSQAIYECKVRNNTAYIYFE